MSQTTPGVAVSYPAAELDRRFYAFVIDRLIAWGIFAGAAYLSWYFFLDRDQIMVGIAVIVGVVVLISLIYAVLLGVAGLSPGKALVGLRVVRDGDGRPIGVSKALVRTAVLGMFTLPTLGLGLATLAWTAVMDPAGRRRGGHDRMTDAVVVDVRPEPEAEQETDVRPRQIVNLTAMRLMPTAAREVRAPQSAPVPDPAPAPGSAPAPVMTPPVAPAVRRPLAGPLRPATPPPTAAPPPAPPAPRSQAAPATPPVSARWHVAFDTGEEFVVEGLCLVGRRPEPRAGEPVKHLVPLRSSDMSLSKTHAQFQVVPDGALVVMDRGSTNGSVVVRQGVSKSLTAGRPATLLDGDTVSFGDRKMIVTRTS